VPSVLSYLGVGANLEDPRGSIDRAVRMLDAPGVRVRRRAPLYRCDPVGPAQPDFLNTAVEVETSRAASDLLDHLKSIEAALGRTPTVRWGPRIIDLDILLYGDAQLRTETLTIPHPELHRRRFALAPLEDLVPDLQVPGHARTVRQLGVDLSDAHRALRLV
jgi:2-amino-4-hydroxy-6-hydroxymethyldihydropteridine diphosphokinase